MIVTWIVFGETPLPPSENDESLEILQNVSAKFSVAQFIARRVLELTLVQSYQHFLESPKATPLLQVLFVLIKWSAQELLYSQIGSMYNMAQVNKRIM